MAHRPVEDEVLTRIVQSQATEALHNLTIRMARAVEMRDIDEAKLKEVARKLDVTDERVRQLQRTGEFHLRQKLRSKKGDLLED